MPGVMRGLGTVLYSVSHLIKVRLVLKKESRWYTWRPERRYFFGLIRYKEGFWSVGVFSMSPQEFQGKELENCYHEESKVYYKPHVTLCFSDKSSEERYFKDEAEARVYYNKLKIPGQIVEL